MWTHVLKSWARVGPIELNPGDEFSFDESGDYVVFARGHRFLAFTTDKGNIHVYTDETCADDVELEATLKKLPGVGSTIWNVFGMKEGSNDVQIETSVGVMRMYHPDQCCEVVHLLDVSGDPNGLVGGTIVVFETRIGPLPELKKRGPKTNIPTRLLPKADRKLLGRTYTFYEIRTTKGDVTLRWGEPDYEDNGRYGEEVVVKLLPP